MQTRRPHGFSLIEMMIVVAIMGLIGSQAFRIFSTQKKVYVASDRALDVQEGARLVLDLVSFDARMAGFMVPGRSGLSSIDGGSSSSDRLCISDASYFDTPIDGTPAVMDSQAQEFPGAVLSSITSTQVLNVDTLDIDGDGDADFVANGGVIVSDGIKTHCAQVQSVSGTAITLISTHPIANNLFATPYSLTSPPVAVPATVYEVSNLSLTRNGLPLASSVEDLQVEYWVDGASANGEIDSSEFPIHDLNANPGFTMDHSLIRQVRISVITRTELGEAPAHVGNPMQFTRPAAGNRPEGTADEFRRRKFSASVVPRNMI